MRFKNAIPILAVFSLLCAASLVRAQDPPQESSSKPADQPSPAPEKPTAKPGKNDKKNKDTAAKSAPDSPLGIRCEPKRISKWDSITCGRAMWTRDRPLRRRHAGKTRLRNSFRFLGEAQEKKGLKKQASTPISGIWICIPRGSRDKIQKRIDKLRKIAEKQKN